MDNFTKSPIWIVARTIANGELNIRKYLEERGVPCFVPTKTSLLKRKGEMVEVEVPIIRNMLFFKTDFATAQALFNVNSGRMFRVRDSKGILTVPDRQMETFIRFIDENYGKVQILDTHYVVGDKMMIKKGPLAGMIGKVTQIDNKNYFTITLEGLLVAAVRFPKSNLVKVEEANPQNSNKK